MLDTFNRSLRDFVLRRRRGVSLGVLALAGFGSLLLGMHLDSGVLQALGCALVVHLAALLVAAVLAGPESRSRGRSA